MPEGIVHRFQVVDIETENGVAGFLFRFQFPHVFHTETAVVELGQFIRVRAFNEGVALRFLHHFPCQVDVEGCDQDEDKDHDPDGGKPFERESGIADVAVQDVGGEVISDAGSDDQHPDKEDAAHFSEIPAGQKVHQHDGDEIEQAADNEELHVL